MLYLIGIDVEHKDGSGRPAGLADTADLIAKHGQQVSRIATSMWLVESKEDTHTWATRLNTRLEHGDRLIVAPLHTRIDGLLLAHLWDWINDQWLKSRAQPV